MGSATANPTTLPPTVCAVPIVRGLSLRSNFVWALSGNIFYAACQWGMIVALAKLGSGLMLGQFSLGLAIATPTLMFTNLHLRAVQATDATRFYTFAEYLQLRIGMTLIAIIAVAGLLCLHNYEHRTVMVVLAVTLAKGIETLSDIYYGLFQLNDRLDHTGRSMMLRGALSLVALSGALVLTHDVFWACVAVASVWMTALVFFDVRWGRRFLIRSASLCDPTQPLQRHWNLLRLALPLGIVTTLASVNLNMPRYFIAAHLGEHQLGIFSALAYSTVAITLVGDSLGTCAAPRMSRLYALGELVKFNAVLLKLLVVGALLGLMSVVIAWSAGQHLLALFYSSEYSAAARVFFILMVATALHCVAGMLTSGILAARCFRIQVPMFAAMTGASAIACYWLVPAFGLAGGAMAMVVGAIVRLLLATVVIVYLLLSCNSRRAGQVPQNWLREWSPIQ